MTKREAAVLQAYTGFKMLEGFDQEYAEQYINELWDELSKPDFIKICLHMSELNRWLINYTSILEKL